MQSKKLLDWILIAGSSSFVFYLFGLFGDQAYYAAIGIQSRMLDFGYYDYVVSGLQMYFVLIFVPLLIVGFYLTLQVFQGFEKRLQKKEREISAVKKELVKITSREGFSENMAAKLQAEEIQKDINQVEEELQETRKLITSAKAKNKATWSKVLNSLFWTLVFLPILVGVFFLIKGNLRLGMALCANGLIGLYAYELGRDVEGFLGDDVQGATIRIFHKTIPFLAVGVFFLPLTLGFVRGKVDLKEKKFQEVRVIDVKGTEFHAAYVLFTRGNYFFFINERLTLIPESQILQITKY